MQAVTVPTIMEIRQVVMSSGFMVLAGWFVFRSHCTLGIVSCKARIESPPVLGRSIRGSFWRAAVQICIDAHVPGTAYNPGSS